MVFYMERTKHQLYYYTVTVYNHYKQLHISSIQGTEFWASEEIHKVTGKGFFEIDVRCGKLMDFCMISL